jgi:hypothetical protein
VRSRGKLLQRRRPYVGVEQNVVRVSHGIATAHLPGPLLARAARAPGR